MKVAIHKPDFEGSFASKWIEFCIEKKIDYLVVDCLDNDIIQKLKKYGITHLLWHFSQKWKDLLTARNILFSAEMMGMKVFPSNFTCWHFDDKISQKYLLEALDINLVNTYVFYDKVKAINWISENRKFPVVAKLRRGSGSTSVKLIKTRKHFISYASKMFSGGLNPQSSIIHDFSKRTSALRSINDIKIVLRKLLSRISSKILRIQVYPQELGYIYLQEFIPNCSFDIRIIVIRTKAYGIKRLVRKNDFRASGSGRIIYEHNQIPLRCIKDAFFIAKVMKSQCVAIDFLVDKDGTAHVTEISYGFSPRAYDFCEGYWEEDLSFHQGTNILEYDIIESLINEKQ